jgi:peptide/nickel transport system permease protein
MLDVAAHVTGRNDVIAAGATRDEAVACVRRWEEWWLVHRADYVAYDGPARLAATIADTQYARWTERMISMRLGVGTDGVPILDKLRAKAPRTLAIAGIGVLVGYLLAIALGLLGAARHRRTGEAAMLALLAGAYAAPTACVAAIVAAAHPPGPGVVVPGLVLALGLVASPARQQQASLLEVIRLDWVRAARAHGAGPLRIVVSHALPNTLGPTLTLLSLELPTALAGAFVVEQAFGVPGLGEETIRAVQTRDVAWLMTIAFASAAVGALALLVSDIALSVVDPRLRTGLLRRGRAE